MKIVCSKSNLVSALTIVSKAIPSNTTMSILQCIMIDTTAGDIKFITNNMELGIQTIVEGEIVERGYVAIEAKIFFEIIRKLPDNDVTINSDENSKVTITCEKAKFALPGRKGDDFTNITEIDKKNGISISQYTLKSMINQTIFSVAPEGTPNKIMSGELMDIQGDTMRLVSLDGHRISIRKVELPGTYEEKKLIIPGKTLGEISKIISDSTENQVSIFYDDNHVMFEFDDTIVVSRLIEGEYYDIDRMLSSDYETKATVNLKEFLNCIDRATLLAKEGDKKPVVFSFMDGQLEMKISSNIGSMDELVDINKQGKDLMIGFNAKFLIDVLRVINDEEINLYMVNPKSPCFIKSDDGSYIYMVLPVNFIVVD